MDEVSFTERELEIMQVLWDRGSATVAEVRERLAHDPAHTTVLTLLRVLESKGHVRREPEGRAHRYHPTVARQVAARTALRRVLGSVFGGEPELLMTELLAEESLDEATLQRLKELVDERLAEGARRPDGGKRRRT